MGDAISPTTDSVPDTLTETSPLLPAPPVKLPIAPKLVMDNVPALTATLPALPVPMVTEPIPFNIELSNPTDMSIVTEPAAVTETFPALPAPKATVPRDDPESIAREPSTETATPP